MDRTTTDARPPLAEPALSALNDALRGLEFGSVTLIVQDGVVIQIDRVEKRRLRKRTDSRSGDNG